MTTFHFLLTVTRYVYAGLPSTCVWATLLRTQLPCLGLVCSALQLISSGFPWCLRSVAPFRGSSVGRVAVAVCVVKLSPHLLKPRRYTDVLTVLYENSGFYTRPTLHPRIHLLRAKRHTENRHGRHGERRQQASE